MSVWCRRAVPTRAGIFQRLGGSGGLLPFCEGVGLVKRVHTLLGGVHRLATALKEVEEVRQEVREVKDEENGEIKVEGEPHTS